MAITITSEPLVPDMSNKDLLYLISSTQTDEAQFQYVCDIKDAAGTLIQRIKQQPNPNSKAVFNIGQIITNQLEFDLNTIKTGASDDTGNNNNVFASNSSERWADDFIIAFGEEYGTSVSSSVTLYTGVGTNQGNPAVISSTTPTSSFFAGTKDFNRLPDTFNWISGSLPRQDQTDYTSSLTLDFKDARKYYDAVEVESGSGFHLNGMWLTEYPNTSSFSVLGAEQFNYGRTYKVRKKDFLTLSFLNGNFDFNNQYAQDIAGIRLYNYDFNEGVSDLNNCAILNSTAYGGGPRTSENVGWGLAGDIRWQNFNANGKNNIETQFMTINVGFNQIDGHNSHKISNGNEQPYVIQYTGSDSYLMIQGMGYDQNYNPDIDKSWGTTFIQYVEDCNYYDTVRFAWKNIFGNWDWYTATLAQEATSDVERLSYDREVINYSAASQIVFNSGARGTKNYINKINRNRVVNTDWLTQQEAEWLRELFFSTEVFIQDFDNERMLPVVIKNASITEKTNPRTQKVFQYRVEFEMANDLTSRQG